jgi:hypothetical protein
MPGRLSLFYICRVTGICFQSAGGPAHSKTLPELSNWEAISKSPNYIKHKTSAAWKPPLPVKVTHFVSMYGKISCSNWGRFPRRPPIPGGNGNGINTFAGMKRYGK